MIVSYVDEESAKENLHAQGYSIIEIQNTTPPSSQWTGTFFYFTAIIWGVEKSWKIFSDDIFRAYVKLIDDLKYDVQKIYSNPDATIEEVIYTTAKIKESYLEYKKKELERPKAELKEEEKARKNMEKKGVDTVEKGAGVLEREVLKYQTIINRVVQKLENFVEFHAHIFWEERTNTLKELLLALKQLRKSTNINKLKIIWEASLVKIGSLELEISESLHVKEREEFLKQTNQLLKDLWSSKQIGGNFENAKEKLKVFFWEVFWQDETEEVITQEVGINKNYLYWKNLRDYSIYKEKLKEVQKELFSSIFWNRDKRRKLLLKKKLILQNISIIQSRIEKKKISYTRIVKGISYYNKAFIYAMQMGINFILYSLAGVIIFSTILWILYEDSTSVFTIFSQTSFIITLLFIFSFLFYSIRNMITFGVWIGIFLFLFLLLQINF